MCIVSECDTGAGRFVKFRVSRFCESLKLRRAPNSTQRVVKELTGFRGQPNLPGSLWPNGRVPQACALRRRGWSRSLGFRQAICSPALRRSDDAQPTLRTVSNRNPTASDTSTGMTPPAARAVAGQSMTIAEAAESTSINAVLHSAAGSGSRAWRASKVAKTYPVP